MKTLQEKITNYEESINIMKLAKSQNLSLEKENLNLEKAACIDRHKVLTCCKINFISIIHVIKILKFQL